MPAPDFQSRVKPEGDGLQPVRNYFEMNVALATEGTIPSKRNPFPQPVKPCPSLSPQPGNTLPLRQQPINRANLNVEGFRYDTFTGGDTLDEGHGFSRAN